MIGYVQSTNAILISLFSQGTSNKTNLMLETEQLCKAEKCAVCNRVVPPNKPTNNRNVSVLFHEILLLKKQEMMS
jgi:hypothetical protein